MNSSQGTAARRRRTREEVGRLVSQFLASGLSAAEFCRSAGLAPSTLRRRLNKQRATQGKPVAGVRLLAVKLNGAQGRPAKTEAGAFPPAALEVRLGSGRCIGVAPGFDGTTLSRLVQLLEAP
jgi:transposase-like protein